MQISTVTNDKYHSSMNELFLRCTEIFGVFIVFIGVASVLALLSYCAEDLSFNTAIDGEISNWLARPGSFYADWMIQLCGISSYLLSLYIIVYGYHLIKFHHISFIRFIIGIISVEFFDILCTHNMHAKSGIIGQFCYNFLSVDIKKYESIVVPVGYLCIAICFIWCSHFKFHILSDIYSVISEYIRLKAHHSDEISVVDIEYNEPTLDAQNTNKKRVKKIGSISHKLSKKYAAPSLSLLKEPDKSIKRLSNDELKARSDNLVHVLNDFGIQGEITGINPGPVVTLYELKPAAGIKSSRVIGLSSDIARYMSAISARVAVIPGRNALGIELPNEKRQMVYLREILDSHAYKNSTAELPIALGKDIGGEPIVANLARMPHLLVAGTTGSGKSVGVNAMILSLLYRMSPDECKFIMVDPKMLELSVYNDIPHLLTPVVTDPKKAVAVLKWAVKEMETRYLNMSKLGVRNIEGYNKKLDTMMANGEQLTRQVQTGFDPETGAPIRETQTTQLDKIPYIVIIVDEMADLMLVAGKEIEIAVQRLAQMARAAGLHLIMATQRPSVDVITGTIKANFPTRISFQVSSKIDSRTILGEQGAEQLLGQGDMLYMASGGRTTRIHCPFVSDKEVEQITNYLKTQGEPHYVDSILQEMDEMNDVNEDNSDSNDPLYKEAVNLILNEGKASTSFLQRRMKIGYNRAARLIDMMESAGIVSPANHVGKREILGR